MSKLAISVAAFLFPITLLAGNSSQVAGPFEFVNSPRAVGMGECVVTLVSEESPYYNPASLGLLHTKRSIAGTIPFGTTWPYEWYDDLNMTSWGASIGTGFGGSADGTRDPRWSLGVAYSHIKLDYGTFYETNEYGMLIGSFDAYESAECLSAGVALHGVVDVGVGASAKFLKTQFVSVGMGRELGSESATSSTFDLGALIALPLDRMMAHAFVETGEESGTVQFKWKLSAGIVVANVTGDYPNFDAAQSAGLPRLKRVGLALGGPITYKDAQVISTTGAIEWGAYDWSFDDKYQKLGVEASGLGIAYFRFGKIDDGQGGTANTWGYGLSSGGVMQWLKVLGVIRSGSGPLGRAFGTLDVSFDWSKYKDWNMWLPAGTIFKKIRISCSF